MYFSYDKGSDADLYALDAADVAEIIKMNRNGIKPESLRSEPEPYVPEFVTAVGDDSISRFDAPKRKKSRGGRNRNRNKKAGEGAQGEGRQGGGRRDRGRQDKQSS
jgi:hypothetical protein